MENELLPRLRDLYNQSVNKNKVACTSFLTPKEQAEALAYCKSNFGLSPLFIGGYSEAERRIAFFLPDYIDQDTFDPSPYIKVVEAKAPFLKLSHRDYLGALMNMGIERECIGDIIVTSDGGYFFLIPTVAGHVLSTLSHIGRGGVSLSEVAFSDLPPYSPDIKETTFTVMSLRADAVTSGIFKISRSACQDLFIKGDVVLNYFPCYDRDEDIAVGDVISLRHYGKAKILSIDGKSKKGRTFVTAGIYQ